MTITVYLHSQAITVIREATSTYAKGKMYSVVTSAKVYHFPVRRILQVVEEL